MNCPSCSAPLKADARFCPNCGATITQAAATPAPAVTDRTMIASAVPPLNDSSRTPAAPPAQSYPSTQPYPTQQPQYQQNYQQPQYQQPQYQQNYQQSQYQQGYQQPQYQQGYPQPVGYNVPQQFSAVPPKNGQLSAMLLILSSLAMIVAIFLPFFTARGLPFSLYEVLTEVDSADIADEAAAASILFGFPAVGALGLIFSILAFIKRRNVWGALTLVLGLVSFGFAGLLLIGISASSDSRDRAEIGLLLFFAAGGLMFIDSIVYLARKKVPR